MSRPSPESKIQKHDLRAEFDLLADEYRDMHRQNLGITGEAPEYFAEYKIADLAKVRHKLKLSCRNILDFGSGVGNSLPYFRKYFSDSTLSCADISLRSIEIAQSRFPGSEAYLHLDDSIPLPDDSQDIVFSACVFHHIPHEEHAYWLRELLRVTKPGGILAIYEHNPFNLLTVRAVNTCPLDVNARLIKAQTLQVDALAVGWASARIEYKLFFPAVFAILRPFEPYLTWLPLGGQYRLLVVKPQLGAP